MSKQGGGSVFFLALMIIIGIVTVAFAYGQPGGENGSDGIFRSSRDLIVCDVTVIMLF